MITIEKEIKLYDKYRPGEPEGENLDSRVVTVRLFGLRIFRYRTTMDRPYSEFWRQYHQAARQLEVRSQQQNAG